MDLNQTKQIFDAIKTDNLVLFSSLIVSKNDLNLCFGRFPILSLCYLYNSNEILNYYENDLFQIKNYNVVQEFFEMYEMLKTKAKKSLRLYLHGEVISPIEMLSILDERQKIAKDYQKFYKNDEITSKIEKIYFLTHKTQVQVTTDSFVSPPKKLNKKSRILVSLISFFLVFMMIFPIFGVLIVNFSTGLGLKNSPIHINSEKELKNALSNGSKYYILDEDIILSQNICVENFSGILYGNGKTIFAGSCLSNSLIKNLSGKLENLKLKIEYENLEISQNMSFLAQNLTGIIENCEIYGHIKGVFTNQDDAYFSLFVKENSGEIKNSLSNVEIIDLTNSAEKNAFYSAFVAENKGTIINCKSTNLSVKLDTIDSACFAINNTGKIESCENNLSISQSSSKLWHPNTAGIAISNNGEIESCVNNGEISSMSSNEIESAGDITSFMLYASGIVIENNGKISGAENNGNISSNSIIAITYASGIVITNNNEILNSKNNGEIFATSKTSNIFVSGISCYNTFTYQTSGFYVSFPSKGSVSSCVNNGLILAESTGELAEGNTSQINIYAGGIVSFNYTNISASNNNGKLSVKGKSTGVYAGGIVGLISYTNFSQYLNVSITNCISKCDIDGRSELSFVSIGGICGYCNQGTIDASGFIGSISCFANVNYVGGVCGDVQYLTVLNSYASSSFVNENDNATKSLFGILSGRIIYGINSNLSSNKIVEMSNYPAFWVYGNETETEISAQTAKLTIYSSLQELLDSLVSEVSND